MGTKGFSKRPFILYADASSTCHPFSKSFPLDERPTPTEVVNIPEMLLSSKAMNSNST